MDNKKITINGNVYTFENEYHDSRCGFSHKTMLYKNGGLLDVSKVHYINRTWESYRFQTSMKKAVSIMLNNIIDALTEEFKTVNGFCRITENRKQALADFINGNGIYNEYCALYAAI